MPSHTLKVDVLNALAARGTDPGITRLALTGYSDEEIEGAVKRLRTEGLISAHFVKGSFGQGYASTDRWEPGCLTETGWKELKRIGGPPGARSIP